MEVCSGHQGWCAPDQEFGYFEEVTLVIFVRGCIAIGCTTRDVERAGPVFGERCRS